MKVYLVIQSDYDASDVLKVCKSEKKAQKLAGQMQRLFDTWNGLFDLDRIEGNKSWEDHPELIAKTKMTIYRESDTHKKLEKLMKKTEKLIEELGGMSFYSQCLVQEKKLE